MVTMADFLSFDFNTLGAIIAIAAIIILVVVVYFIWKVIKFLGLTGDNVMDITHTAGDIAHKAYTGPEEVAYRAGRGILRAMADDRNPLPNQYRQPYQQPPHQQYQPPPPAYAPPPQQQYRPPPPDYAPPSHQATAPPSPPVGPTDDEGMDGTILEPPSYRYDPEGSAYHQPAPEPRRPKDNDDWEAL